MWFLYLYFGQLFVYIHIIAFFHTSSDFCICILYMYFVSVCSLSIVCIYFCYCFFISSMLLLLLLWFLYLYLSFVSICEYAINEIVNLNPGVSLTLSHSSACFSLCAYAIRLFLFSKHVLVCLFLTLCYFDFCICVCVLCMLCELRSMELHARWFFALWMELFDFWCMVLSFVKCHLCMRPVHASTVSCQVTPAALLIFA